jgi:hypothetical protein
VRSTADRLEGELQRTSLDVSPADYEVASQAISEAREQAARPGLEVLDGRLRWLRGLGRRLSAWWTGCDVDQAWSALRTASLALLAIESPEAVQARLPDLAATVVTTLDSQDLRLPGYLATLSRLARPGTEITTAGRAQLRAIREACDASGGGAHADARAYRNTLIMIGGLLAAVLGVVALLGATDPGFRDLFVAGRGRAGGWYVLQLELVASLSGLAGAVLALRCYTGFQYSYGLPLAQAVLKGGTGAATGLLGVLLVQSGLVAAFQSQAGPGVAGAGGRVFAIAVIFGFAQQLFTRTIDAQARQTLTAAGGRNDPSVVPKLPSGAHAHDLFAVPQA